MPTFTVSPLGGNINVGTTWIGGVAPSSTDDIAFNALSGPLNLNVAFTCAGINFTNFVNTITVSTNALLTINGPLNLGTGGYTQAGVTATGGLNVNGSRTITSNGTTWSRRLTFVGASATMTLADDLRCSGPVVFNGSGALMNFNGNTFYIGGQIIYQTTIGTAGTTAFNFNGTGTWTSAGGIMTNSFTINTAGTLTLSGTIFFNTGTFTWVAGTVVTTGSNFTMGSSTTLNTNGTSINFNTITFNGTSAVLTLTTDCYCASFTMGANSKTINGANLYNAGSLAAPGNSGNVQGTSTIILNGTGTISSAGSSYIGLNVTINTAGTITLSSFAYGFGTFKYTAGTIINTGSTVTISQNPTTFDTGGMSFNNLTFSIFVTYTLLSTLNVAGILRIVGASTQQGSFGFVCGTLTMGTGQLTLPASITNTITTNMNSLVSTLAARASIVCSTSAGAKAILILSFGATQDNGYLSATDIDSSGGASVWTYKGVLTREINWNQLSSDPRKHIMKFTNRLLEY